MEDEVSYMAMELLKNALSSGLISGCVDSRTVIFLAGVDERDARDAGLSRWAVSAGLELNYYDGALQEGSIPCPPFAPVSLASGVAEWTA